MYQGQMGWLKTRDNATGYEDVSGWALKLRTDENRVLFYLLGRDAGVEADIVDDSLGNKHPNRPYVITATVPARMQALHTFIDGVDLEKLVAMGDVSDALERIREEKKEKDKLVAKLGSDLKRADAALSALIAREKELNDSVLANQSGGRIEFRYAYGKHSADGKEFCWRIPYDLRESVKPGCTAIVETKFGHESCVITRVETLPQYLNHKMVISVA